MIRIIASHDMSRLAIMIYV